MRWLNALLDGLAAGEPMVWVSVARLHGSGPREVGASMVVGAHRQADTIGGGHLEWQAIAQARQLLSASTGHPAGRVCRCHPFGGFARFTIQRSLERLVAEQFRIGITQKLADFHP